MSKITLNNVGDLTQSITAQTTINNNSSTIQTAFDNTLSRDGTLPNSMGASLDMNGNQLLNLPFPSTSNSPVRFQDLSTLQAGGTVVTLPFGGATGQVLQKHSNTDYDVQWGTGLVTSVGLSLPADFIVSNSPVTSAGILTAVFTNTPTGTGSFVRSASPTLTGTVTINGSIVDTGGNVTIPTLKLTGATSGNTTIQAVAVASGTITVPSVTDTLVGRATTDTLTNKTLTSPIISTISNTGTLTLPTSTDTIIGRATTDTLTNKTFDTAGTGNVFKVNGTAISAVTGTGSVVLATSPTLVTPILGTATGTSFTAANGISNGFILTAASGTNGSLVMGGGGNIIFTCGSVIDGFGVNDHAGGGIMLVNETTPGTPATTVGTIAGSWQIYNLTAIPAGGTASRGYMMSSATNFGIFFGSGVPTLSAAQGSIYLRSDGSSTSTRLYVNTNGSTTWTNVTTAA